MANRRRLGGLMAVGAAALGIGVLPAVAGSPAGAVASSPMGGFNQPGNILIADQFNNRIIEINRAHQIVWSFGDGTSFADPHSIVGPNDAERVGVDTLIAGTGAPAGTEPTCMKAACNDNRVILVDPAGTILWQYGQAGVAGSGPDQLNTPVFAAALP